MLSFENFAKFSPLPIVDLRDPSRPTDGFYLKLNEGCRNNFRKDDRCRKHYEQLQMRAALEPSKPIQCPFGLSSFPFRTDSTFCALTSFVPFPRMGGEDERRIAKRFPEIKIAIESVERIAAALLETIRALTVVEDETIQRHSLALHEIRKLNAKVKQTAERLCVKESPLDPGAAGSELVTMWKAAELMSYQFEVMEILANQRLAELPLSTISEVYRVFDKCVHVYRLGNTTHRFVLRGPTTYHPKIRACEKTLPIIPTVLIENAVKYSKPDSEIRVYFEPVSDTCVVRVSSLSNGQQSLDDSVFLRGVRASADKDGSGNGLYIAQLIAKQHGTRIQVQSTILGPNTVKNEFTIAFQTMREQNNRL